MVVVKHWQKEQRLSAKKHTLKLIMFEKDTLCECTFLRVQKVIAIDVINKVRRLFLEVLYCSHGVLKDIIFWKLYF